MKVAYSGSFVKDLKRLRGQPAFERIKSLAFEMIPRAEDLSAVVNVKKLQGYGDAYRIRVGDYRIGFTFDGETVTFRKVLHRRDIYRYFP